MSYIDTSPLQHSTVFSIYADRDEILTNPDYQRNGDVWTKEKKQLLIDSILNRYDIPKIYFHKLSQVERRRTGNAFAIIDGRQRLEAIWQFIEGSYPLSADFVYFRDSKVKAAGLTYNDLAKKYPKLKNRFDSTTLPIIQVETDDVELIEDMFSRLNEAVPLNAPEKRNAIGGNMVKAINSLSQTAFFTKKVKFANKRYQHREVAVRLLYLEHHTSKDGKVYDTKKPYLDHFAKQYRTKDKPRVDALRKRCGSVLLEMTKVFTDADPLLQAQASVPIYYLLFVNALEGNKLSKITRNKLTGFNELRKTNREKAESDLGEANYELLEYDRLSQQGTNDASSIEYRLKVLASHILG